MVYLTLDSCSLGFEVVVKAVSYIFVFFTIDGANPNLTLNPNLYEILYRSKGSIMTSSGVKLKNKHNNVYHWVKCASIRSIINHTRTPRSGLFRG